MSERTVDCRCMHPLAEWCGFSVDFVHGSVRSAMQ